MNKILLRAEVLSAPHGAFGYDELEYFGLKSLQSAAHYFLLKVENAKSFRKPGIEF